MSHDAPTKVAAGIPPAAVDAPFTPNLSVVIGRGPGTVAVTVEGDLNPAGCDFLRGVLTDLIEGQGNRSVAVDLAQAIVGREGATVLVEAAHQASRLGTRFALTGLSTEASEALHAGGFGHVVEVMPRRAPGGAARRAGHYGAGVSRLTSAPGDSGRW